MTHNEKLAVLVVSTISVLAISRLIYLFNFISERMWLALDAQAIVQWTVLGSLVLFATYRLNLMLINRSKVLEFSYLKLIAPLRRFADNIAILPAYLMAPLAVLYMAVLAYSLPIIAFWEEWFFRGNIEGVGSAIVRTLLFALIHMLVGASLRGSIVLLVPGSFFALVYSLQSDYAQGLLASTYLHVFYDVIAIAYVSCFVISHRRQLTQQTEIQTI